MAGTGNLVASHPGNTSAAKHGLYSGRLLAERAREVRDALLTLQHVHPLDVFAAEELGSLIAALEAIDKGLDAEGGVEADALGAQEPAEQDAPELPARDRSYAPCSVGVRPRTRGADVRRAGRATTPGARPVSDGTKRRAVLEAVLDDPKAALADRIRAVEALERMHDDGGEAAEFYADLDPLPDGAVDEHLDAVLIVDVVRSAFAGEPVMGVSAADTFPQTAKVVREETARLLREQEQMLERAFAERLAQVARPVNDEPADDDQAEPCRSEPLLRVVPPQGIDTRAGWSRPQPGRLDMSLAGRKKPK